jgi:hypothetical protein
MQPVSARWDQALRVGHEIVTTVEVWKSGVRQTLPDGSTSLKVIDGSVTVDEASKVRRSVTLHVANPELMPVTLTDTLAPPLVDLKVFMGVRYTEGDTELVPVGVFRVDDIGQPQWLAAGQITASDYSQVLANDRFTSWATPAGSLVTDEIVRMVADSISGLTVVNLTGSGALTTAASWEHERWDAITTLAKGIGAEVFFDAVGRLIIRPFPQVTSSSVAAWTVDAGTATAVMTDVSTVMSTKNVYNAVIATSSAQGVTATGAAYQSSGPFAWPAWRKKRFYSSPVLTTSEQCQSAAQAILARSVFFSRQISLQSVPNPALDCGDFITVLMPADANNRVVSEVRAVSRISLPLGPATMTLDTRVGIDPTLTADVGSLS